jgi:hypothetical protein
MPEAGPYGKTAPGAAAGPAGHPSLTYDPDLEEADRQQRQKLVTRKRRLIEGVVLAGLALSLSGWWLVASEPSRSPVPAFILIDANEVVAAGTPLGGPAPDTLPADRPIEQRFDSVPITPARPEPVDRRSPVVATNPPASRRNPPPETRRPETRPDTGRTTTPVPASVPAALPPSPAPSPAPLPAPPPPPPPPPPPAPPPRSAQEESRLATAALSEGIGRLVAAINGKRLTELLVLLPESMAGDAGRLERFVDLVKGFAPRATLGIIDEPGLADDRGEARFILSFVWRGDFGVERRKAGRFLGVARRQDDGWRFEGARLLDAVP